MPLPVYKPFFIIHTSLTIRPTPYSTHHLPHLHHCLYSIIYSLTFILLPPSSLAMLHYSHTILYSLFYNSVFYTTYATLHTSHSTLCSIIHITLSSAIIYSTHSILHTPYSTLYTYILLFIFILLIPFTVQHCPSILHIIYLYSP